jgi:hypothetical protein
MDDELPFGAPPSDFNADDIGVFTLVAACLARRWSRLRRRQRAFRAIYFCNGVPPRCLPLLPRRCRLCRPWSRVISLRYVCSRERMGAASARRVGGCAVRRLAVCRRGCLARLLRLLRCPRRGGRAISKLSLSLGYRWRLFVCRSGWWRRWFRSRDRGRLQGSSARWCCGVDAARARRTHITPVRM